jgi:periplasmic protein CpxP/Spy
MQNDSNIKFWKTLVAILIALNLMILAFVVMQYRQQTDHQGRFEQMPPMGESPADFLCRELKFSEEQKKKFDELRNAHHTTIDSLEESNRDLHHDYFDLLNNENPDEQKVSSLADQIAAIQKQKELITFHHFAAVRKLCNEEQKKHFDEIIQEVLRRMHQGQHQPPPHP